MKEAFSVKLLVTWKNLKVLPKTNTKNPNFESMDELRKF